MSTTTNLKAHARALEQQEQWSAALEVYEQLAADQTPGDDPDVGLWNRIGDLHMRMGQPARAVEAYERAVQAYEEAGLHNNALALCGKILRISPGRSSTYLRLGVISALKGFAADARANLKQFVDRATRADQLEQALGTLLDTARSRLADAEVLHAIAEQLREHGWADRLEIELGPECDRLRSEGLIEEADRARAVLDGDSPPPAPAHIAEPLEQEMDASLSGSPADHADGEEIELDVAIDTQEHDSLVEPSAPPTAEIAPDAALLEINPLEGLQSTHVGSEDEESADDEEVAPIAGFDSGRADADTADADTDDAEPSDAELAELPLLTFQPELDVAGLAALDLTIELADDEAADAARETGDDAGATDVGDDADNAEDAEDEELPLIGLDSFTAPADGAEESDDEESDSLPLIGFAGELDVAPPAAAEDLEDDEASSLDREVEAEVPSLAAESPPAAAPLEAPAADEPDTEYIDLSSLIFEDDEPTTTRFVVDAEEPTGDEDRDFAEMLARFREQVSKNIDADDDSSRYDLGVAFKEMGLIDEAISEFQSALRAGANPLATMEMLGECFIEKGQFAVARRILDQAVRHSGAPDGELVGVLYWMGRCEEALGRSDAATECYERVLSVDIRFRDAGSRLGTLRG